MTLKPIVFIGFVGLLLIGAYTIPTAIADTNEERTTVIELSEGDTANIYNSLNATVDNVTAVNATVTLEDTAEGVTQQQVINNDSTATYTLDGDVVDVTLNNLEAANDVELTLDYQPTFGMTDGLAFLTRNLGAVVLGFLLIIAFPIAWTAV